LCHHVTNLRSGIDPKADVPQTASMSDPRRSSTRGWSTAGAVASLVLLSIALPARIAFFAAVRSAPFFGVQPSVVERAESAGWLWAAFVVSAASAVVIVVLLAVNRRRGGVAVLAVMSVLAVCAAGFWLVFALGTQRAFDAESSTGLRTGSPSPSPTIVMGRFIPDDQGTATANALIKRLGAVTFSDNAGPVTVGQLVARAGADNPEVRGTHGDVAVGVFVGAQTCVLGEVRAGLATWSVTGVSADGGCLGAEHG
jgi:hypothetical protein